MVIASTVRGGLQRKVTTELFRARTFLTVVVKGMSSGLSQGE